MVKRRRKLTPKELRAVRERKATKRYERLWNNLSNEYGAKGQPSPHARFNAPAASNGAVTYTDWGGEGNTRRVNFGTRRTRQLARLGRPVLKAKHRKLEPKRKQRVRKRKQHDRKQLKRLALHEWAHVYQDPAAFGLPGGGGTKEQLADYKRMKEGTATVFARRVGKKRFGGRGKQGGYKGVSREARKKYDREFLVRGQFGERYGKDPRQR